MSRRGLMIVLIPLAVAALLRVPDLGYDLPELYEEATPMHRAWAMWPSATDGLDLNPHHYNYPAGTYYVHLAAQMLYFAGNRAVGRVQSLQDFRERFDADPSEIVLLSRAVVILFALGTVVGVFYLGKVLAGWEVGLIAACALAVFPDHVRLSRTVTVDVPTVFWGVCALTAITRYAVRAGVRQGMWVGAFIGLSASSKYTGAMYLIPFWIAHALSGSWRFRTLLFGPGLWVGSAGALAVFLITSPYCILDFGTFWQDFSLERLHMSKGHFGKDPSGALWAYAGTLGRNLGIWLAPAAVWGLAVCILRRDLRRRWLPLVVLCIFYLGVVLAWSMYGGRYLLPLFPCLALFVSLGIVTAGSWASGRTGRNVYASAMLSVVLLLPIAWRSVPDLLGASVDTRTAAKEWLQREMPDSSLVAVEYYTPNVDEERSHVLRIPMMTLWPELSAPYYYLDLYRRFDFLVVSSGISERYANEPDRFATQCGFYQQLATGWDVVASFQGNRGPNIRVYRNVRPGRSDLPLRSHESPYRKVVRGDLLSARSFLRELGRIYLAKGWVPESDQAHKWFYVANCRQLMSKERWQDAIRALEATLEFARDFDEIQLLLAVCRLEIGDLAGAQYAASRALGMNPKNGEALEAYMAIGKSYLTQGNVKEAEAVFLDILEMNPDFREASEHLRSLRAD